MFFKKVIFILKDELLLVVLPLLFVIPVAIFGLNYYFNTQKETVSLQKTPSETSSIPTSPPPNQVLGTQRGIEPQFAGENESVSTTDTKQVFPTPIATQNPDLLIEQKTVPVTTSNAYKTYPIIPLGDLSGVPDKDKQIMLDAYTEFLKSPDLRYLNPASQNQILKSIFEKHILIYKQSLEQKIQDTQEDIDQLNLQNAEIAQVQEKLNILSSKLKSEEGQGLVKSVVQGRKENDFIKWTQDNAQTYSLIMSNDSYFAQLYGILVTHQIAYLLP